MKKLKFLAAVITFACGLGACVSPAQLKSDSTLPEIQKYLGDWQPSIEDLRQSWPPHKIVAKDGSGTHVTLQSAINSLPSAISN